MENAEEPATSAGASSAQSAKRLIAANKGYRIVGASVIAVVLVAGFTSAYALDANEQLDSAIVESAPPLNEPEPVDPKPTEPEAKAPAAKADSSLKYSQTTSNGSSETKVYVNGQRITVPKNSSTNKTITNKNGDTTHISVQNNSSGTNVHSSSGASSFVDIQSHSYTHTQDSSDDFSP